VAGCERSAPIRRALVTRIADICDRLQRDTDLPVLLDTAYTAYELLLSAIEEHQDPVGGMFVPYVYAATLAANGRDAILFAPSLPIRPLRPADAVTNGRGSASTVDDLVALSEVLCRVLARAAGAVAGQGDAAACQNAARCAADIHRLLTGAEP
jgi:hypothetical protein